MYKRGKGITIAREILLTLTFFTIAANFILMIIQLAMNGKESKGFIRIKDKDSLPF